MDEPNCCWVCGRRRPVDVPGGLCPDCLARTGLGEGAIALSESDRQDLQVAAGLASSSVLATLVQTLGRAPQVRLGDIEPGSPGPRFSPGTLLEGERSERLKLFGVIGRGGMGVVLRGHDTDLGRDLAVKVLREQFRDQPGMVRRFIEEAQIGGQLQHPGVVPVYELGTFADHRPYIAMRLVKGRNLADVLAARKSPAEDQPRLLGIFESVCQTMAYAHARGVIHRDLKPSNVMVGGFGEVQVMDWGLAKVLPRGEAAREGSAPLVALHDDSVVTGRSGDDTDQSRPGSVLGTPAYMAPEQARGEVDSLDERADVFALGSILCEILTGSPAFLGETRGEIEQRAARGEVAEAQDRLDACGADPELTDLAMDCLAPDATGRPRDAQVVAQRITHFRIGLQEKFRTAELAKVAAQARAEEEAKRRGLADQLAAEALARAVEERRRQRLTLALAASVLVLVVFGGGATAWLVYQRQTWQARVDVALREAELLRDQAAADPDSDLAKWQAAQAALRRVRDLRDAWPGSVIRARLEALEAEIQRGSDAAEVDRTLVTRLEEIRGGLVTDDKADAAFAAAFQAAGLDVMLTAVEPELIGRRLAGRPRAIALASAAALDTWVVVRRGLLRPGDAAGLAVLRRALTAARVADNDPWRNALRDSLADNDKGPLRRLAQDPDLERQGPVGLWLLGHSLEMAGDHERALEVLRRAQRTYPGDYWLNTELGLALLGGTRSGLGATNAFVSSQGIPDARYQRAEPYFLAAVALRPRFGSAHLLLGTAYLSQGRWDETFLELREALRLQPDDSTIHNSLGIALAARGKPDEAAAAYRAAIRIAPRYALAQANLADLLLSQGKPVEAVAAFRETIRLAPEYAPIRVKLGLALFNLRRYDEAIAEYREAIRIAPQFHIAHLNLGATLRQRGDYFQAAAEFRTAFELYADPQWQALVKKELARTERWSALAPRLDAVLRGEVHLGAAAEKLEFAYLAHNAQRFAGASRLFTEAFEQEPKLVDDRNPPNRYNAACSAALAASGQARAEPPPDAAARARLRRRAHQWLQQDLAAQSEILRRGQPAERAQLQPVLQHWKVDPDLESIRAPEAVAQLPKPERKDWQALWAEVDSTLRSSNQQDKSRVGRSQ